MSWPRARNGRAAPRGHPPLRVGAQADLGVVAEEKRRHVLWQLVARDCLAPLLGALSAMYSAMFTEITLDDDGSVRRLDHHSEPGELGSLIPADYFERPDRQLKLWVFHQEAADGDDDSEQ